jgi:hypothetical protein
LAASLASVDSSVAAETVDPWVEVSHKTAETRVGVPHQVDPRTVED